jgi:hypothetical protein
MANITISGLPTLGTMTSTTVLPVDSAGTTYQMSGANLSAYVLTSVPGANVTGTVSSATTAGTVTTAAQPNITSVGTLASLGVTGDVTATNFIGSGTQLTGVGVKVTGSWTVTPGTNNYDFTVPQGSYQMWINCNIPNGIILWNATVTVSNINVPVIGQQYAWNYTGAGSPILFTSIPDQFRGTVNAISNDNTYIGTTSNTFEFGINNASGSNQTVNWGYIKIS